MTLTTTTIDEIKDAVLDRMESKFAYIAVGTDDTTPSSSDTALGNEVLRKSRQEYLRDDTNGKITVSMWILSTEANGNDLKEVGVFDTSSGGNLYSRNVFNTLTKNNNIEVWIDVEFTTTVQEVS